MTEERPNPEQLLKAIQNEEKKKEKGRLKIFLGMSAGVGKTFTMLEEAKRLQNLGEMVVVGSVETHGRIETGRLLEGLTIIPEKWIKYRDTVFEELDLDEILKQKPDLVIVDELAHSNVPGSRHFKRWQDVEEILDKGIDVFTTLNVQHIESLKDVVENIAGIQIKETVPDSIIEKATFIELVDLTPYELLERLKEGKVYLGDQSAIAARNFFQEDRLTALRELALRFAAEKVDHELHGMVTTFQRGDGWRTRERLLVSINENPDSQKLIRTTRRIAFSLNAPWIALHVNVGKSLGEGDKTNLAKHLALARDLGGEVITTNDPDLPLAIARIAKQKNVTQIIIGRQPRPLLWGFFSNKTLLDKLARECPGIDIHVIRKTVPPKKYRPRFNLFPIKGAWLPYFIVAIVTMIFAAVFGLFEPYIGYKNIGFGFLLGILGLSLFFRKGPILMAAVLYSAIWCYFFVPGIRFDFPYVSNEDVFLIILFLSTALFTGILIDRTRLHREMLIKREESSLVLYEIVKSIASSPSLKEVLQTVCQKLGNFLKGKCQIFLKKMDDVFDANLLTNPKEKAAAHWVFENGKEAGWSTTTLPSEKKFFLPLKGFNETFGVLTFQPTEDGEFSLDNKNFLYSVSGQLVNYLERKFSEERERKVENFNQTEKIYQTIFNLISSKFHDPIKMIQDALGKLKTEPNLKESTLGTRTVYKIIDSSEGLVRDVENISSMAKLSAGQIPVRKKKHQMMDLIDACLQNIKKHLSHHDFIKVVDEKIPPVAFDFSLMEILVSNLILNAIENSPPHTTIKIEVKKDENNIILSVLDEGKGIPTDMLEMIFDKFTRLPESKTEGLGLGLSIAKTIAEVHGGTIKAENRPTGGTKFTLTLPLESV